MTEVAALEAYAGQFSKAAQMSVSAAQKQHEYVHNDALTDVDTESGPLPSLAKQAVQTQEKVTAALSEVASQMAGAMTYADTVLGLEGTVLDGYFSVPSPETDEYLILYRNAGGTAVEVKRYPSALGLKQVADLVQSTTSVAPEAEHLIIADEEGAVLARLMDKRLEAPAFNIVSEDSTTRIGDDEDAVVIFADDQKLIIGGMEIHYTDKPGIFAVDEFDQLLSDLTDPAGSPAGGSGDTFAGGLLFQPLIVTAGTDDAYVYTQGLVSKRELADAVTTTLTSTTTEAMQSGPAISVNANRFGAEAWLNLRSSAEPDARRHMLVQLRNVPVQNPAVPISVLLLSDSIGNYQGAYLLKQRLEALGFIPTFIGTVNGSATGGAQNAAGPLGEARPGWKTSDYSFSMSDRAIPVAEGDEAVYLDMIKADKLARNPFLRPATPSDPEAIVRNGYVFDVVFYAQRFGLAAPDIVINGLGTNDARDETPATIYDVIFQNDTLIHSQIQAAWPQAKILRTLPATAYGTQRNAVWRSHYSQIIKAMKDAAAALPAAKITVAPLWAFTNPDGGYTGPAEPAGSDGFIEGNWSDPLHFSGAPRQAFYKAMAPYIAAQKLNII